MNGVTNILFRRHDLSYNDLPKIGEMVLVEDKKGRFFSAYLVYRGISKKVFDWFLYDGSYLAELESGKIIAWYEIPEV